MRLIGWGIYLLVYISVAAFSIHTVGFLKFVEGFLIGLLIWRGISYVVNKFKNKELVAEKETEEEKRERTHRERVLNAFKR